MQTSKSQRLTIRPHNIEFLKILAAQMELTDLSEVLNYLLLDCKGLGYSFGSKPHPQPQPQQAPLGYSFDTSTFETAVPVLDVDRNYQEDPVILRMSQLIEEF